MPFNPSDPGDLHEMMQEDMAESGYMHRRAKAEEGETDVCDSCPTPSCCRDCPNRPKDMEALYFDDFSEIDQSVRTLNSQADIDDDSEAARLLRGD